MNQSADAHEVNITDHKNMVSTQSQQFLKDFSLRQQTDASPCPPLNAHNPFSNKAGKMMSLTWSYGFKTPQPTGDIH